MIANTSLAVDVRVMVYAISNYHDMGASRKDSQQSPQEGSTKWPRVVISCTQLVKHFATV